MRKLLAAAAVICIAVVMLLSSGCSEKDIDIAFVTALGTDDAMSPAVNCMNGVVSYAEANGLSYEKYTGQCRDGIDSAVSSGAEVIVLFGVDDENTVYSCAGKYPEVRFICVDFGNDFLVRSNICCLNVSKFQCGVYAGYCAVREGGLLLGIQGEETAETYNYIRGFVEGAQLAAVEIGVSKKPVNIYYNVSGSDMAAERISSWYDDGCALIFCSDETYEYAAEYVSDADMHKIISFGADRTENEDVAASVYGDYSGIVSQHIGYAYDGSFRGGMMITAGAADGAVGFACDSSIFSVVTASDIEALNVTISNSDMKPDSDVFRTPSDKGYKKIVLTEMGIVKPEEEN